VRMYIGVLGSRVCNECEGGKVVLFFTEDGIFSKCLDCGFTEWEWTWGDNPDYLEYLARVYGVSIERIYEELRKVLLFRRR